MKTPDSGLRAPGMTRRSFVGAAAMGLTVFSRSLRAADFNFTQYHNQPATSSLHLRLAEMWAAIRKETNGRVETQVFPMNNGIAGSDPAAFKMLIAGDLQFFTLMGGIIGTVVPVAEVRAEGRSPGARPPTHTRPSTAPRRLRAGGDGGEGIHGFRVGGFDNGMRQITLVNRPIVVRGISRDPHARAGRRNGADMFRSLGAEPIVINSADIHASLKAAGGRAGEPAGAGAEIPLYEVVKYISMTNHMWSGFNQMAHKPTWDKLPADIRTVIDRNVTNYVRLQRQDQDKANNSLRPELVKRGLVFNDIDPAPFRKQLAPFYAKWKEKLGTKCWSLLEQSAGRSRNALRRARGAVSPRESPPLDEAVHQLVNVVNVVSVRTAPSRSRTIWCTSTTIGRRRPAARGAAPRADRSAPLPRPVRPHRLVPVHAAASMVLGQSTSGCISDSTVSIARALNAAYTVRIQVIVVRHHGLRRRDQPWRIVSILLSRSLARRSRSRRN